MASKYSVSAKLHSRRTKGGVRPVYVVYTYDKESSAFPTSLSIHESNWDLKNKQAVVGTPDAVRINTTIQQIQSDLLSIAAGLLDPRHELIKRRYASLAEEKRNCEFNRKVALAYNIGELGQIEQAEEKLAIQHSTIKQRKEALRPALPALASIGVLTKEAEVLGPAVKQFADLFLLYAGTGETIPGQFDSKGKPKRDQGSIKHYKPDTYKHVRAMWSQLNEFSRVKNYPLTLQSINLQFYQSFGDYILFDLDNYDNHFGSLIKRVKTFLLWCEAEQGVSVHPQVKSRKFKVLSEEKEVIILSDEYYRLLADFRTDPDCKPNWVKYIDMTLFQSAMGLRHSDMRRATWRVEGAVADGVDHRVIKGTTSKNKSTYIIPAHLNPEWTLGILEKYGFDFNETARSSRHKNARTMVSEQKLNQTMKSVLQMVSEKHHVLNTKILVTKKKWGQEYELGRKCQWEMHSSHDNRRAFITRMYRAGNSEKLISRMVGTKSLPELRKYQQVNEDDILAVRSQKPD